MQDETVDVLSVLRERIMNFGGMQRSEHGAFWIDRDDVLRAIDEACARVHTGRRC